VDEFAIGLNLQFALMLASSVWNLKEIVMGIIIAKIATNVTGLYIIFFFFLEEEKKMIFIGVYSPLVDT
jgi:hypothetical protein